ncbi:MAG TPA: arsenite methyltransferase [Terriglobales bacterium]|nr:arsenite methyltransferase [Terriglobales bacterium]
MASTDSTLTESVRQHYSDIAEGKRPGCGCSSPAEVAVTIGYSSEELKIAGQANLGLGCGNPLALAAIEPGMVVLDLGSGAGFDAFLAWRKVGPLGRVIGVDMTDQMLQLARKNAAELGAANVEFRKGTIENLPVDENSVDLVISNCVINLSTSKPAVFREIYRVLKPGGGFAISDLVLLSPLPKEVARDVEAYVGCIAGASLLTEYITMALEAGFDNLQIPQITASKKLGEAYGLDLSQPVSSCCGPVPLAEAARAVVSAKLHGRKSH